MWLPLACPLLETWPKTQACALTGNQTRDSLVPRLGLNPLSHTSQGLCGYIFWGHHLPYEAGPHSASENGSPRPHDQLWRPSPQSCAATTLRPSLRPSVGGDPVEWPTAGSMGLAPGCALASGPTCLFIFLGPVSSQGMFSWGQLLGTQEAETKSLRPLNLP